MIFSCLQLQLKFCNFIEYVMCLLIAINKQETFQFKHIIYITRIVVTITHNLISLYQIQFVLHQTKSLGNMGLNWTYIKQNPLHMD